MTQPLTNSPHYSGPSPTCRRTLFGSASALSSLNKPILARLSGAAKRCDPRPLAEVAGRLDACLALAWGPYSVLLDIRWLPEWGFITMAAGTPGVCGDVETQRAMAAKVSAAVQAPLIGRVETAARRRLYSRMGWTIHPEHTDYMVWGVEGPVPAWRGPDV